MEGVMMKENEKPAKILFTIEILEDGNFNVIDPELGPLKDMDPEEVKKRLSYVQIQEIVVNPFSTFLKINSGCFFIGGKWKCVP
jgi:hypothetical protein